MITVAYQAEVRQCFSRFDSNHNQRIDLEELELLCTMIYSRLGAKLTGFDMKEEARASSHTKPWQLSLCGSQVKMWLHRFDKDGSNDLDYDEFVQMLLCDPFATMFPEVNDMKNNAVKALKRFCALDLIIIDGDPSILPWSPEARQLLRFVYQVRYSQQMEGSGVCMIGSGILGQILQYITAAGPKFNIVFNGSKPGFGSRSLAGLKKVDVTSEIVQAGGVYLDNSTGDMWHYKVT